MRRYLKMAVLKFLTFVAVLGFARSQMANYVAIIPSVIRPGNSRDISVTILRHVLGNVTVTASMVLVANGVRETVNTARVCSPGTTNILELDIPVDLESGQYTLNLTGTGALTFSNVTEIRADLKFLTILVQTDKATYKPGDLIRFRALAVFSDLTPYMDDMTVTIKDGNDNTLRQYPAPGSVGPSPNSEDGVFEGQLQLSDQPVLGTWKIRVEASGQVREKEFIVEEYVLPKYEVSLSIPDFLHPGMTSMPVTVQAKYTYGQPVEGDACIIVHSNSMNMAYRYCMDLERGIAMVAVSFETLTRLAGGSLYYQTFMVDVEVTETLTGNVLVDNKTVTYEYYKLKMDFLDSTPDTFKSLLPYTAYLQVKQMNDAAPDESDVVDENGRPKQIQVTFDFAGTMISTHVEISVPVERSGITPVRITVPDSFTSCSINARMGYYLNAYKSIEEFVSRDDEAIQVGSTLTRPVQRNETVEFTVTTTDSISRFFWEIYSKGRIVASGSQMSSSSTARNFTFSVEFERSLAQEASPSARVLVYYFTLTGEIVADSIEIQVDALFANEVSVSFDVPEGDTREPRDNVTLMVRAMARSYVGLLAVDKSVLLLRSGNDLSQAEVQEDIQKYDSNNNDNNGPYYEDFIRGPAGPMGRRRKRSSWCFRCWPIYSGGKSTAELFENAGLVVFTDGYIHEKEEPVYPPIYEDEYFMMRPEAGPEEGAPGVGGAVDNSEVADRDQADLAEPTITRTEFVETWLWAESHTGDDGTVSIQMTLPDTITSWVASAFALHRDHGLGIAGTPAEVTVFLPFFASLNLPYSIIRGERFRLQVVVFNYEEQAQNVLVTLKASTMYRVFLNENSVASTVDKDVPQTIRVGAGTGANAFFWIEPKVLGQVELHVIVQSALAADALKRHILVEPQGVAQTYTRSYFVDLTDGATSEVSHTFNVYFPTESLVEGSQRLRISAMADLMGSTIENLDHLLQMPYGCGEQNMLNFAPNIYVLEYLIATSQLTSELEGKAKNNMEQGYQRELTYQRTDGSFSAFGNSDSSGSTWLTAFVARCFNQARGFIQIEQNHINRALNFILQQHRNGIFDEPGRVIHTDMQGGSSGGFAMSAYVLVTLLENSQTPLGDQGLTDTLNVVITTSLDRLRGELTNLHRNQDKYALSVATYALTLAANTPVFNTSEVVAAADTALGLLEHMSSGAGAVRHWTTQPVGEDFETCSFYCPPPRSNAIEMTAYALLTYAVREDISGGLPIMKWLLTQQNSFGGYGSTQDTVIGIMALSRFASIFTASDSFSLNITARGLAEDGSKVYEHAFQRITNDNTMIFQFRDVDASISQLEITATGRGVALVQMAVSYHVEEEMSHGIHQYCNSRIHGTNTVDVVCCASWTLDEEQSGMVVSEIATLSGYQVDTESITVLNTGGYIRRYEVVDNKLIYYFDELTSKEICFTVRQAQVMPVENIQSAVIKTYKYYETSEQNIVMYRPEFKAPGPVDSENHVIFSSLTLMVCTVLKIILM